MARMMTATRAENDGTFTPSDWGLFLGVSVIWGASFLLIAEALEGLTPGVITLGRVGLGAVTLWGLRLARGRQGGIEPQDWGRIVALSLLWVAIPFTLFPLAQEHINSAVTGLLNGATPVFAAIISVLFVKVVPKGVQLWGLAVGFGGVVLISFASSGSGTTQLLGVILVLAATGCYGISLNIAPPLQAKYGAVTLMSAVLTLATIWVLPFGLVSLGDSTWSVLPVLAVVALGAIGTGFAYWIMSSLVGRVGGIRASFITYLIPVVSLVLGVAIRGDVVRPLAIVGAVMTILGAFFASRRSRT